MPSDNTYNNPTPASAQDPCTYQHAAADACRLHHQPPQAAAASQFESLPCPRCNSKNTKFCYYNNYNLSQPRHFCKACRRYWTHGGTLRNVPVGGGTRKSTSISYHSSNKRPRSSPAAVSPCSSSSAVSGLDGASGTKTQAAASITSTWVTPAAGGGSAGPGGGLGPGFTSQLSTLGSNTFLALGGYGPGFVPALDGLGFGFSRGVWPFAEAGFIEGGGYGGFHVPMVCPAGLEAWHIGPGGGGGGRGNDSEGELTDGEGFAWPDLAISMPGQGLK